MQRNDYDMYYKTFRNRFNRIIGIVKLFSRFLLSFLENGIIPNLF